MIKNSFKILAATFCLSTSIIVLPVVSEASTINGSESSNFSTNKNWKDGISESLGAYLQVKIDHNIIENQTYNIGKIVKLKDKNDKELKYYVSLVSDKKNTIGYAVLNEEEANYEVLEFSLGGNEPLKDNNKSYYYYGPLNFAEDVGNGKVKDLRTDSIVNKSDIQSQNLSFSQDKSVTPPTAEIKIEREVTTAATTDYEYKVISGVPDYQQNNNSSMSLDCVPTAAANIIMYWDTRGYPDMSSSNSWLNVANRIGIFTYHNNTGGVHPNNVSPGLDRYFDERGYTGFSEVRHTIPNFSDIRSSIKNGHPSLLGLSNYKTFNIGATGGHMVTTVGYESYYDTSYLGWRQQVIVHDNWEQTGVKVWLKWNDEPITDFWEIHN